MAAPRAPAILLSLLVSASGLLRASTARADEEPQPQEGAETAAEAEAAATAAVAFPDARFGPRYVIDDVVVRGNHKTNKSIIVAEATALGLVQGAAVDASDPRVEAVRYRLLALGYFLDVRLSVTRGAARGGVVLVVEVEERGTIVINEFYPSTSAATTFWGGADVSETNLLGHGINLGAGFVASTTPEVPEATRGLGLRLRAVVPPIGGPYGLSLSATALYNDSSEFYRVAGADDDSNPLNFVASRVKRAGGVLGVGKDFRSRVHAGLDFRQEALTAELPTGGAPTVDFMIQDGTSRLGSVMASVDLDTRSDPILPRSGMRIALSLEAASSLLGSSYEFVKTVGEGSFFWPMPRGHALGLHVLGGAIFGDAPYFDRFFIGDLNLLMPRRALGINFSTVSPPSLLGTSITHHRYDNYAGRVLVEYAIPIWRRRGFVYGGDAFVAAGLVGVASVGDFQPPGTSGFRSLPIDLTGDLGLRLDTYIGIFTISVANALSRLPL